MVKSKNIILLSILILLVVASALVPVSLFPIGSLHITLQIVKGLLLTLSWAVFYYLIKISFLKGTDMSTTRMSLALF